MQPNVFLPFDAEITRPCGNIVCGNIMRGKIVQYPIIRLQVCNLAIFQWVEILFLFPLHFVKDLADNEIICLSINISIFTEAYRTKRDFFTNPVLQLFCRFQHFGRLTLFVKTFWHCHHYQNRRDRDQDDLQDYCDRDLFPIMIVIVIKMIFKTFSPCS